MTNVFKLHYTIYISGFMDRTFTISVEKGESGYLISEVLELPGCHTQAKTMKELIERTKEAIELYLEAKRNDNGEFIIDSPFIGIQEIKVNI